MGFTAAQKKVKNDEEAAVAEHTIQRLKRPASDKWIAARCATMLMHYYVADLPEQAMTAVAGDWMAELKGKPAWAILRAVRWWMGDQNPKRRQKPLPGDISEIARDQMRIITYLEMAVSAYHRGGEPARIESGREPAPDASCAESRARVDELVRSMFRSPTSGQADDE